MFVAGDYGTIFHRDSIAWQYVSGGQWYQLEAVWGLDANNVWTGGGSSTAFPINGQGSNYAVFGKYDGTGWSLGGFSFSSQGQDIPSSIWASSSSDIFVGIGTYYCPAIVRHDGTQWAATGLCNNHGTKVYDLSGISSKDVIAVGNGAGGSPQGNGWHWDGSQWFGMGTGTWDDLQAVWATGWGDAFAVGKNGKVFYFNGTTWQAQGSGTASTLNAVWGTSPTSVFTVGASGAMLYYNGSTWSVITSVTTKDLFGIRGTSTSNVYAVGDGGLILHFDGSTWKAEVSGTGFRLRAIWGSATDGFFAVGERGTILYKQ